VGGLGSERNGEKKIRDNNAHDRKGGKGDPIGCCSTPTRVARSRKPIYRAPLGSLWVSHRLCFPGGKVGEGGRRRGGGRGGDADLPMFFNFACATFELAVNGSRSGKRQESEAY